MNAVTPIIADAPADLAEDLERTLAERLDAEVEAMEARHLAQLQVLSEVGVALAKAVGRRVAQAEAEAEAAGAVGGADQASGDGARELADLGLVFNRVARGVRLTMSLEARVRDVRRARLLGLELGRAQAAARKAQAQADRRSTRRLFIGRLVEDTVKVAILKRSGHDARDLEDEDLEYEEAELAEIEAASDAADNLLKRGKAYVDVMDRPVSAVVTQLCADLGLTPEWSVWADEDWAIAEAESLPGSPFVGLIPAWAARGPP
jgi:hypothetical protein